MPGLLRGVARTAAIAGTATAVSNRVSRRQANRWSQQGGRRGTTAAVPARARPAPRPRPARGRPDRAAQGAGGAQEPGHPHRRRVRGAEGQDPGQGDLTPGEREALPGRQDAHGDVRRVSRDEIGEPARGLGRVRAPPHPRAGERAPVDRHRDARPQQRGGPRRALGVHVPRPDARPPAPDREQRDVEIAEKAAHAVEHVGVAEERDAGAALDHVGDRRQVRPDGQAPAVVLGGRDVDVHGPEADACARGGLDHPAPGPAPDDLRRAGRREHGDVLGQPPQRAQIEVVVMSVREEDGVSVQVRGRRRGDAAYVADPCHQHRVCQQAGAVDLDQGGRVADIRHAVAAHVRRSPAAALSSPWRARARRGRRDAGRRTPAARR